MGEVVLRMLSSEDRGVLDANDLRTVGQALELLGADMVHRAEEINKTIPAPVPTKTNEIHRHA